MRTSPAAGAGTVTFGGTLTVNRVGFGAMRITGDGIWGPPADRAECQRVLHRALDLGIDFIDTADSYGPAVSETLIADTLFPYPAGLVVATKGGLERPGPHRWVPNGRPEYLRAACERSLTRLRLERIDLYQLHRIDPAVPEADQFGVLRELCDEGKIRYVGLSEAGIDEIERARRTLPVVSVQNKYNAYDRTWDAVVEHCERSGLVFIPWYPLNAGATGSGTELERLAEERHLSPMQAALVWLLDRSPVMLPIAGTSKVRHLEENVAAAAAARPH